MRKVLLSAGTLVLLLGSTYAWHSTAAGTPDPSPEECRRRFVYELAVRRDEFRAHVFGARKSKTGKVTGLTRGEEYTKETKGILETKERMTSELIEPIVQSYRAYRCKERAVCDLVAHSFNHKGTDPATVQVLGCEEEELTLYPECFLSIPFSEPEPFIIGTKESQTSLITECQKMAEDSLDAERQIIRMAVAYDSGYRSTLQFAGMMDWMMEDLPTKAVRPIRDMVNMLGKLHIIPCYIGQCDNPDTSSVAPSAP